MERSPEYLTVKKLQPDLRLGFINDMKDLAIAFNREGLIDGACYDAVFQEPSTLLPLQKADKIFESVLLNMHLAPGNFQKMKVILNCQTIHKPLVKLLEEEYANQGGDSTSATSQQPSSNSSQSMTSVLAGEKGQFSEDFSAAEFADWMKKCYRLDKDSCDIIEKKGITGFVFSTLKEKEIQDLGFNFGACRTLTTVLAKIQSVSVPSTSANQPVAQQQDAPREPGTRTVLENKHYGILCEQLVPLKTEWEPIANSLGFHPHEIKAIQAKLNRTVSGDYIYDVIESYLRWGPGDKRGSKDVATLEEFQRALNDNGFVKIKLKVTL